MHKLHNLFAAFTLGLTLTGLTACLGNGGEIHETHMMASNGGNSLVMYADQTIDSIHIVSYDSWRADISVNEATPWVTISPKSADIPQGYGMASTIVVRTEVNKTGRNRLGNVQLITSYADFGSFNMPVQQFGWLNITLPEPRYTSDQYTQAEARFEGSCGPKVTSFPLNLRVWGYATVTSDVDWLTVPEDKRGLQPGKYELILTGTVNDTGADRVAHVEVTSNGVTNTVTYKQLAK